MNDITAFPAVTGGQLSAFIAAGILFLICFLLLLFRDSGTRRGKVSSKPEKDGVYLHLLEENEVLSNLFFAKALLGVSAVFLVIVSVVESGLISVPDKALFGLVMACLISVTATAALLTIGFGGKPKFSKSMLAGAYVTDNFLLCILLSDGAYGLLLLFPVILSVRYFDPSFSARMTAVCAIADLLSRPSAVFYGLYNGTYSLPGGAAFDARTVILNEFSSFILTLVLIVFGGVCAAGIARHGRKILSDGAEMTEKKNEAEREAQSARTKIMLSQLQPHFLYNSLSAIMAIDGNPPQTVDALADFSRYLRMNLNSLTSEDVIPFAAELEHTEHYLALEKLRFKERINIVTDIRVTDFSVPPLSVQMAVENAVKHGITQKPEGGTVRLTAVEDGGTVVVTVEDDGVGFDTSKDFSAEGNHVGLASGKKRIEQLLGGTEEITSIIGEGTRVEIRIPREKSL